MWGIWMGKLLVSKLRGNLEPGRYADGDGLYLVVSETGRRAWLYRYQINGKRRDMSLGSYDSVGLKDARQRHAEARALVHEGVDPIDARKREAVETAEARSFSEVAALYIETHRPGWRNAKHASQWRNTLATYAAPHFGAKPIADIDTADVLAALKPIWTTKTETASRLRSRIELVIDFATARGWRAGENPARLKGHIDQLLPKLSRIQKVKHHPAMPYADVPGYFQRLSALGSQSASILRLIMLTACRTGEVIGARWDEFDLASRVWTIPATRMKAGREHRVPLSRQAIELIEGIPNVGSDYLFPGQRGGTASNMTAVMAMRRHGVGHYTPHGFRSAFRDWTAEETSHPHHIAEMALAHTIKNQAEAAYRRGDLLAKRAVLMTDWGDFVAGEGATDTMAERLRGSLSKEELIALAEKLLRDNK